MLFNLMRCRHLLEMNDFICYLFWRENYEMCAYEHFHFIERFFPLKNTQQYGRLYFFRFWTALRSMARFPWQLHTNCQPTIDFYIPNSFVSPTHTEVIIKSIYRRSIYSRNRMKFILGSILSINDLFMIRRYFFKDISKKFVFIQVSNMNSLHSKIIPWVSIAKLLSKSLWNIFWSEPNIQIKLS